MVRKRQLTSEEIAILGGIAVVCFGLLLVVFIPELIFFILLGVIGLMGVAVYLCFSPPVISDRESESGPKITHLQVPVKDPSDNLQVSEPQGGISDMAMLFGSLLATIIFLIFRSHNPALDIYSTGILGVFALTFFRYLYSSLFSQKRVETIPSLKEQGILDIAMENAMLFLIIFFAIIISLQSAGNYQFIFMALAGILVAAHLLDYGIRIRNDRRAGTTSPHRKIYFLIPLLRDGLLLWCSLTFTFFVVEVLPAISHFQPVTFSTLIIMSVLIVSSYLLFRLYSRLWFGNWHDRFLVRTMVPGYAHRLGRFLLDICLRYLWYVLALIVLNSAVALTLLLVWNDIIQLDLSHANGFVLFLMFTAGNFLIICVWVLRESERL